MARTAVVLFNLGGPDGPQAVRPFLFNLFNDPAILRQPPLVRWFLARLISRRRAAVARDIYARIGGKSPILEATRSQARALAAALDDSSVEIFICMRYWHPMTGETVAAVKAYDPDRIVLLPLYPQFSTTTTASSRLAWQVAADRAGLSASTVLVCCYPTEDGFIDSLAGTTRAAYDEAAAAGPPRVIFSAHGLPKKFVDDGDPYQGQVERTVAGVAGRLAIDGLDFVTAYQSRVGRLEWLRPYTDDEIVRAGTDGVPVVVVPVAFVSEHSETLVELDIDYAGLARRSGVPRYVRVPTVGAGTGFISGLARLVRTAQADPAPVQSGDGETICGSECGACPRSHATGARAA